MILGVPGICSFPLGKHVFPQHPRLDIAPGHCSGHPEMNMISMSLAVNFQKTMADCHHPIWPAFFLHQVSALIVSWEYLQND